MNNIRKRFTLVLAGLMLVSLLAGCGSGNEKPSASASATNPDSGGTASAEPTVQGQKDLEGEIVIWSWSEGEVKLLAENFNKVYPNVKVKYVPIDNGDVTAKLQAAAVSGGDFPDIAYQEVLSRGKLFSMDIWEDLSQSPYGVDKSLIQTPLLSYMETADGRILGVDREFSPSGFVFRRSLAKEYLGTDDPQEVFGQISDWDRFIEVGKQVREKSGGKVYMLAGLDDINWMLSGQYKDAVFTDNTAKLTPYFTHMLDPMIKIRDAGIAGKMKRWTPAWNASYNEGNILIYEYAPWSGNAALKPNAPDAAGDWTVIPATGGPYSMGGTAYGIPKKAKNKELAWEFIRWTLLTEEGVEASVKALGSVPSYKPYADALPDGSDPYFNGQDVTKFLLEEVAPDMQLRGVNEYDGVLNDVMNQMMGMIENDSNLGLDKAVELAIAESKKKLPSTMRIE